jgi:hypothetical protein
MTVSAVARAESRFASNDVYRILFEVQYCAERFVDWR